MRLSVLFTIYKISTFHNWKIFEFSKSHDHINYGGSLIQSGVMTVNCLKIVLIMVSNREGVQKILFYDFFLNYDRAQKF